MRTTSATGSKEGGFAGGEGFTLVELVVALTVVAILAAASVPGVQGVIREHEARQPLRELVELAQTARDRALRTGQACQIGFDATGFYAADYFQPYIVNGEYERLLEEARAHQIREDLLAASEARFGLQEARASPSREFFLERRDWPEGVRVKVRPWGSVEWSDVTGGQFQRWVFERSGLSLPLLVRIENGATAIEARFHALTGDIERERVDAL